MTDEIQTRFDAIVVGTGPGGATVAKELSAAGREVLMLERGGETRVDDTVATHLKVLRFNFIDRAIPVMKGITAGGSSMLYCACAFPPPLDLFRRYGIELTEEVEEIRKELPIGPLPDHLVGPKAKRIMESAVDLGYDWQKLEKYVDLEKCDGTVPYEARWNARRFVDEARRRGATLKTRARVTRVLLEGGAAVGVEFVEGGRTQAALADTVVVAAGGTGSPTILRRSGIQKLGEGFFCDPVVVVIGSMADVRGPFEPQMSAGMMFPDDGYMLTDVTLQPYLYRVVTGQVLRFDRLFDYEHALTVMVKAKDEIGGTLTERGGIRRTFSRTEIAKMRHGAERAKDILRNAGATHIFRTWYSAAHPGATAPINRTVDANLRTEYRNLYVCDCSVIPESWGQPPTFTLIALGKRLGKHLVSGQVS
jgi:choline dehydrogenase-like flavoprotein